MARLQQKTQAAVTTGSAGSTGIPRATGYGLYALSLVCRAFSHHRWRIIFRRLDPSVGGSGPRDFAVRMGRVVNSANTSIASRTQRS
jgi:hypothetical protein